MNDSTISSERSRVMQLLFACLLGLVWLIASPTAHADTCSGVGGNNYQIPLPASVTVPRDAPVGTMLTGWTAASGPYIGMWNCTAYSGGAIGAYGSSLLSTTGTATSSGGRPYTVYASGYPGIGIIIAMYDGESTGGCSGFYNEYDIGSYSPWYGSGCGGSGTVSGPVGGIVSVALVKTANQVVAGTLPPMQVAKVAPGTTFSGGNIKTGSSIYTAYTVTFTTSVVQIINGSCTTPDVSVPLGTWSTTSFTGAGSTTTAVGFNVSLNNCPAGMNSISYRVDPTTSVLNSPQSVVALDSSSTATGVGVQLLNNSSNPLPLSSYQTFSGYSSSTGGSYTIPLKARYYQTGATVGPGPANTSMTLTMQYL
ncbi:fimbrial protein [Paraburkholderia azotifigens]|uniref:Fimbrial protein n=2 Tax=Paraburkholderia azotifigens TaxID=2057004 RepID=A0ABU9RDN0_9BURK|nr:fimbrial protein [Paraburkholderia azotifigens]